MLKGPHRAEYRVKSPNNVMRRHAIGGTDYGGISPSKDNNATSLAIFQNNIQTIFNLEVSEQILNAAR